MPVGAMFLLLCGLGAEDLKEDREEIEIQTEKGDILSAITSCKT